MRGLACAYGAQLEQFTSVDHQRIHPLRTLNSDTTHFRIFFFFIAIADEHTSSTRHLQRRRYISKVGDSNIYFNHHHAGLIRRRTQFYNCRLDQALEPKRVQGWQFGAWAVLSRRVHHHTSTACFFRPSTLLSGDHDNTLRQHRTNTSTGAVRVQRGGTLDRRPPSSHLLRHGRLQFSSA